MTHAQERLWQVWQKYGYIQTDERPAGLIYSKGDLVCVKENPMSRMFVVASPEGINRQAKSIWKGEE